MGGGEKNYDLMYFLKGSLAGGICCSITHGALTPVDVVKTRVQLDPVKYNTGLIGGFKTIIKEEGAAALSTGFGATAAGYFVQGWFKFGGVEFFKIKAVDTLGTKKAWAYKTPIYLGAAACAEFIADCFLCPLEAVRIRSVSDPEFCDGLADGFAKMFKAEGVGGFYAGFAPILAKQVPYTMAKFAVQGNVADATYAARGKSPSQLSSSSNLGISLFSGTVAGVAAAIISHPADTLLSKVNKAGAGGDGPMVTRLMNIAKETGFKNLCTVGLLPRCVMIGTLTAGQFGIFDSVMNVLGASKFHFTDPSSVEAH
jgi:solute carrier family 25 phosphate transporter 3